MLIVDVHQIKSANSLDQCSESNEVGVDQQSKTRTNQLLETPFNVAIRRKRVYSKSLADPQGLEG